MIKGECLCGTVEFEATSIIAPFELCHCSRCRTSTGSRTLQSFVLQSKAFALLWVRTASACSSYRWSSGLLDIADFSVTTVVLQCQSQIRLENGLGFLPAASRHDAEWLCSSSTNFGMRAARCGAGRSTPCVQM